MSRDMNSDTRPDPSFDRGVMRMLDSYAESLRAERPSAALNARMEDAIASWAKDEQSRSVLRRPSLWVASAASLVVIAGGVALLAFGQRESQDYLPDLVAATESPSYETALPPGTAVSPLATGGQVSLYPAEGAVFRVRANLASAVYRPAGQTISDDNAPEGERQYWVDVRIANDGTMRIVQVLPAERGRVVPLE